MPVTYHFRNDPPSPIDDDLVSPHQEPLHDDSIVLSDLIRTGETSRLRRRGAMRIEAAGSTSSRHNRWRSPINSRGADDAALADSPGYTWTIVENRSPRVPRHLPILEVSDDDLEDSDSDSGDEMVFSASFNRAISEQAGHLTSSDSSSLRSRRSNESVEKLSLDNTSYSLVCGGPVVETAYREQTGPESVYSALTSFILPQPPPSPASSPPGRLSTGFSNDSNGCGTVVHTSAFYQYRHHEPMWAASTSAADVVVPLERMYFNEICFKDQPSSQMIKQEPCGCLRIGIGCAVCGNPLGFRLTPCKVLREYISSRQSLRRRWSNISNSSANVNGRDIYLYTFFPSSTTSPENPTLPSPAELTSQRRRDRSRSRNYPLLPPPPPLIRLMSDSDMSDSDEEVIIDFRTPTLSATPSTFLGGDVTASPEPTVIRLEPNPSPAIRRRSPGTPMIQPEDDSELGQARASWANVVRGVEAAASSLGENIDQPMPSNSRRPSTRLRSRRDALGFDAESQLGLTPRTGHPSGPTFTSHTDIPSVLFEQGSVTLTPPHEPQDLPASSSHESDDRGENTPRPTVWDRLPPEEHPSTSFWGRPTQGDSQWTWSNEVASSDVERQRGRNSLRRLFDPDGEFLEGLDEEWGEDMARRLGFSSMEDKTEETSPNIHGNMWW